MKDNQQRKHLNKFKKDQDVLLNMQKDKLHDKVRGAQEKKKVEMLDYKHKCMGWTEKHDNIKNKIKDRETKIDIFTKKHKTENELRFQDLSENIDVINDHNFQRNCRLDEKHLALTLMNQDRKMFM